MINMLHLPAKIRMQSNLQEDPRPTTRSHKGLGVGVIILLSVLGVLLLGGLSLMGSYNGLVTQDEQVKEAAGNIDSQLKRRADLIPNLVNTVKGYAKHEKGVFDEIAKARSQLLNTHTAENPEGTQLASNQFNSSLGRLLAIAENYPNLKADQNFIQLQDELAGTENRMNQARFSYNDVVKQFNTKVRSFPVNIIAGMMGFSPKRSIEATVQEKATPNVNFE
jgi:LemA protein